MHRKPHRSEIFHCLMPHKLHLSTAHACWEAKLCHSSYFLTPYEFLWWFIKIFDYPRLLIPIWVMKSLCSLIQDVIVPLLWCSWGWISRLFMTSFPSVQGSAKSLFASFCDLLVLSYLNCAKVSRLGCAKLLP